MFSSISGDHAKGEVLTVYNISAQTYGASQGWCDSLHADILILILDGDTGVDDCQTIEDEKVYL